MPIIKKIVSWSVSTTLLILAIVGPLIILIYTDFGYFDQLTATRIILPLIFVLTIIILASFIIWRNTSKTRLQGTRELFARVLFLFLLPFILISACYILSEKKLRDKNHQPGLFYYGGFQVVDELEEFPYYISDSIGMIRLDPKGAEWRDRKYIINSDGFRSHIEFSPVVIDSIREEGNIVIAIIGDSHTEGCWASKMELSYPDLIDSEDGILALNFGMGGTDPLQYLLVARTYLSTIRPDHLFVSVCLHTDWMTYERIPSPGIPFYYTTDAGWISSQLPPELGGQPNELFSSAEEAYQYYLNKYSLFGEPKSLLKKMAGKLVITTKLWQIFRKSDAQNHPGYFQAPEINPSYQCLKSIQQLADSLGINLTFTAIPQKSMVAKGASTEEMRLVSGPMFGDIPFRIPQNIELSDYAVDPFTGDEDIHFNDSGHRKFADFVLEIIREKP